MILMLFHVALLAVQHQIGNANFPSSGQNEETERQEYDGYAEPIPSAQPHTAMKPAPRNEKSIAATQSRCLGHVRRADNSSQRTARNDIGRSMGQTCRDGSTRQVWDQDIA